MKILPEKIAALMFRESLTKTALARETGLSRMTIRNTLKEGKCSGETARRIANALDCDLEDIIENAGAGTGGSTGNIWLTYRDGTREGIIGTAELLPGLCLIKTQNEEIAVPFEAVRKIEIRK